MSFRNRLGLFFVLIVVVPMVAVAFMLFGLIDASENGKFNASLAARHDVAQQLFGEQRALARRAVDEIAGDRILTSSIAGGERRRAAKRARQLVKFRAIERIVLLRDGRISLRAGDKAAVAPAIRRIRSSAGHSLGRLEISVIDAPSYARRVRRITGLHTVVYDGRALLASTLSGFGAQRLPPDGDQATVSGREFRVVSFDDRRAFAGQRLRVATLATIEGTADRIRDGRLTAGGIMLGFLLIAIACAALVSRENVELHEAVVLESVTDELTGLSNTRAFHNALVSELERGRRYGQSVGLVLLDIDDFKIVNDTYGHQQGDVVLREVARVLRETSRDIDHPARPKIGDELAVVVPGTDLDGAFALAERLRERIGDLRIRRVDGQGELAVTASCGVAAVPPVTPDPAALEASADGALYEAKHTGKNKTVGASSL